MSTPLPDLAGALPALRGLSPLQLAAALVYGAAGLAALAAATRAVSTSRRETAGEVTLGLHLDDAPLFAAALLDAVAAFAAAAAVMTGGL